jgi:starvation-inducible DNA-binding protein
MEALPMSQLLEASSDTRVDGAVSPLEETLVDLLDLSPQADQALWRLEYSGSEKIHGLLDDFLVQYRCWDRELSAHLPAPSSERLATLAAAIPLELLPAGKLRDKDMVAFFGGRFAQVAARLRARLERLGAGESVARDLMEAIVVGLDRQSWMLHFDVHTGSRRPVARSRTAIRQDAFPA